MPKVYLSLGSNVDRDLHIRGALVDLEAKFGLLEVSGVYETDAIGFQGPAFYNLVAGFESSLPPQEISSIITDIEANHGRTKDCKRFAPRTLDIDLLLYGEECLEIGRLKLPRPDITRYAFMLEPLAEIAGSFIHPTQHQTIAELWSAFDKHDLAQRRLENWR